MIDVIIFGTGGHAKVVYDILLTQNLYRPVAFLSTNEVITSFLNLPHFHQSKLAELEFNTGIVAIGDNMVRSRVVEFVYSQRSDFHFITAVHLSAAVASDVILQDGIVVMAQTAINSGSRIGSHVIVNTSSSIDHDCNIGKFSSIAPGCILGGNVEIGNFSAVSLGAKIVHGKKIGYHAVIGAGALVLNDIDNYKVAYGSPCKIVRTRVQGEKYL